MKKLQILVLSLILVGSGDCLFAGKTVRRIDIDGDTVNLDGMKKDKKKRQALGDTSRRFSDQKRKSKTVPVVAVVVTNVKKLKMK